MEGGVEFVAADAPYANKLMLHILAAFAEHEREQISERTRLALAAAKARGVRLGINGARLAEKRRREAIAAAEIMRGPVRAALTSGAHTLSEIATELNSHGYRTRDGALWSVGNTHRLLRRLDVNKNKN